LITTHSLLIENSRPYRLTDPESTEKVGHPPLSEIIKKHRHGVACILTIASFKAMHYFLQIEL
jgi:hypothetical protein